MISLPIFALPLPGAQLYVVLPLSLSIYCPLLILPTDCFPYLPIIPPCSFPLYRPPSGYFHPFPQWTPVGSQSRQVRPDSIQNANLSVIEEDARFARPGSEQFIVNKMFFTPTMYISSVTGGIQA